MSALRVLVTGSAGFLGQHLARELVAQSHHVVGVDREHGDLRDPATILRHLEEHQPDVVVHLAAKVGRLFGEDDPAETILDNATMTTLIARACGQAGARLVYASTSEVYGDCGRAMAVEKRGRYSDCEYEAGDLLPHNIYGLSKRWGEEACRLYASDGLVLLRFSMPYGPGHPPGRGRAALTNFLWQALHRQPIPVHRGSERSWCWVEDTARAVRLILESGRSGPFNVGRDDDPRPLEEVARMACDLAEAPHDLIHLVDPPARQTVVKRLATGRLRELGWKPEVELDEGMAQTLAWLEREVEGAAGR